MTTRTVPGHPAHPLVLLILLLLAALLVACDASTPTTASSVGAEAVRPAPGIHISAPTPLSVPAECPNAFPVDVNDRGTIVGWTAECGADAGGAFRLYPDGTWDPLPEPNGAPFSVISIGAHDEVYAQVPDTAANGQWLTAVIDATGRITWLPYPDDTHSYNVIGRPNARGTFVLQHGAPSVGVDYFLWNGLGQLDPVPAPPAGQRFVAAGLNDRETVVGSMFVGDDQAFAAIWDRRHGYTVLPRPSTAALASGGAVIDAHGRVYGQTTLPVTDTSCPFWERGLWREVPTVWTGGGSGRVLFTDQPRCRIRVNWTEALDKDLATGWIVGDELDAAPAPIRPFVASADGRIALADCPTTRCMVGGLNRRGILVGHVLAPDRSRFTAVAWTVDAKP